MSDPASHPTRAVAETFDLRCAQCSYHLRGLTPGGRCPECGLDIARSLEARERFCRQMARQSPPVPADPLHGFGRRWLRVVAAGAGLTGAAHLASAGWAWMHRAVGDVSSAADYVLFVIAVAWTCGAWLLTWPPPPAPGRDRRLWTRPALRLASLALPAAAGAALLSETMRASAHPDLQRLAFAVLPVAVAAQLLGFLHLYALAAQVPRPWAAGAAAGCVLSFMAGVVLPGAAGPGWSRYTFQDLVARTYFTSCAVGWAFFLLALLLYGYMAWVLWRLAGGNVKAGEAPDPDQHDSAHGPPPPRAVPGAK